MQTDKVKLSRQLAFAADRERCGIERIEHCKDGGRLPARERIYGTALGGIAGRSLLIAAAVRVLPKSRGCADTGTM